MIRKLSDLPSIKHSYDTEGYVIVSGLLKDDDIPALEEACERVINRTRSGTWPHRRTVGKQFPPYGDDDTDSWGVQHLMHPQLGEPVFAKWYTSPALLTVAEEILDCREEDLQMELFNLLINPVSHDFALRWHRDDIQEDATSIEERDALDKWHYGIQWNAALYRDSCLYVVPRSHQNVRTQEQRKHSEGMTPPQNPLDMPGSIQVVLERGDTVFYNSNILHCATYKSTEKRATLHGCMGNSKGGSFRARNILQHGLEWMKRPEFSDTLPNDISKEMLKRLLKMEGGGVSTAYSLKG